MDIAALKEKLGDETFTELSGYIDGLVGQRDAAKKESIDGRKGMKAKISELEDAQAKLLEKLGIDSFDGLASLPDAKGQAEASAQMSAKIKALEKLNAELGADRDGWISKHRGALQESVLSDALSEHDFVDRDVVKAFVSASLVWEDDELRFRGEGGTMLSVKDGVIGIAKAKPGLLKSTGTRGPGMPTGSGNPAAGTLGGDKAARVAAIKQKFPELNTAQ